MRILRNWLKLICSRPTLDWVIVAVCFSYIRLVLECVIPWNSNLLIQVGVVVALLITIVVYAWACIVYVDCLTKEKS